MLRDFDYKLKNLDGSDGEMGGAPVTVANEIIPALQVFPPGKLLSGEEKYTRYKMALRAHKGGVQDLSTDEITLIKECVGFSANVLVAGQVFDWCEHEVPAQAFADPKKEPLQEVVEPGPDPDVVAAE